MGQPAREVAPDLLINDEQRLYVLPTGLDKRGKPTGYSCLGFDVCKERAEAYAKWLRLQRGLAAPDPTKLEPGSQELYRLYQYLLQMVMRECSECGVRCDVELTPQLVGLEGKRVEVVDRHGETRRFIVGKSTGPIPIHLEIEQRNSTGGGGVTGAPFNSVQVL